MFFQHVQPKQSIHLGWGGGRVLIVWQHALSRHLLLLLLLQPHAWTRLQMQPICTTLALLQTLDTAASCSEVQPAVRGCTH